MSFISARDETLHAVDYVMIVMTHSRRSHAGGIASRVGLGLRQTPIELAAKRGKKVLRLLRFIELVEDRAHVRTKDIHTARGQGDAATQFRPYRNFGNESEPETTVLAWYVVTCEAERLHLFCQFGSHFRLELVVDTSGTLDWDQFAIDEFAHRLSQHPDFVREIEIQTVLHCCGAHRAAPMSCARLRASQPSERWRAQSWRRCLRTGRGVGEEEQKIAHRTEKALRSPFPTRFL